jgi:hypothetical protein
VDFVKLHTNEGKGWELENPLVTHSHTPQNSSFSSFTLHNSQSQHDPHARMQ